MNRLKFLLFSIASGCLLAIPWMFASSSWVLFFAFVPLLWIEDWLYCHRQTHPGYLLFYCTLTAFFLWNILATWWIAYVSLAGMLLIAFINALLMAGCWSFMLVLHCRIGAPTAYLGLVTCWLSFEFLHFHWAIQWPWLTLGNGFANAVEVVQWYEVTGVLGGSLWILLVNILLWSVYKNGSAIRTFRYLKPVVWLVLLLLVPMSWSLIRYHSYTGKGDTLEVAVLQPNVDPYTEKFSGMSSKEQTQRLASLAREVITPKTACVLAPETALAPLWENDSLRLNKALLPLDSVVNEHPRVTIIAGAITQRVLKPQEHPGYSARSVNNQAYYEVFNSALLIDHSPAVQVGHKSILVSGVEKMPFQRYFSFLGNFMVEAGGMSGSLSGATEPTVFTTSCQTVIGSVICFESAFGYFVTQGVRKGAQVLFIITNDGWWKSSAGITQHFNFARLRAVETRRSIARSANTGISGFINPRGDVMKETPVNTPAAIRASLHLNHSLTFYVRHGDYLGWMSCALVVMIGLYLLVRRISIRQFTIY